MGAPSRTRHNLSLLLNGLAVIAIVVLLIPDDRQGSRQGFSQSPADHNLAEPGQTPANSSTSSHAPAAYSDLLALGLSDEHAKVLVLYDMQTALMDTLPEPSDEFWHRGPQEDQMEHFAALLETNEQLRRSLTGMFGPGAKTDPVFWQAFHPLSMQSPFLSSDEQIALQKFQFEQQRRLAERGLDLTRPVPDPSTTMGAGSWREYQLRSSPLADQLRRAGIDFDEGSFRQTFALLAGGAQSPGMGAIELDEGKVGQLAGLLGPAAAFQLRLMFDPQFAGMARAGRQHGLSDDEIATAHQIISEFNATLAAAHERRQVEPGAGAEQMMSAIQESRARPMASTTTGRAF